MGCAFAAAAPASHATHYRINALVKHCDSSDLWSVTDVADEASGLVGDKFPGSAFTDVFDVTNIVCNDFSAVAHMFGVVLQRSSPLRACPTRLIAQCL